MARIYRFEAKMAGRGMVMSTLTRIPNAELEQLADEKRRISGVKNYPVNPLLIAERFNVEVLSAEFIRDSISGLIRKSENGKAEIYVNQLHPLTRQRFTIAHELGHLFLHLPDKEVNFVDEELYRETGNHSTQEVEANQFAGALLMPKDLVTQLWNRGQSVGGLASMFDVSVTAMDIRLMNLGLLL